MKGKGKVVIGAAAVVVVAAGAWALFSKNEASAPPFLTAQIDRGAIIQHVTTTGTLTAVTTVKVGSQVSGIIATLHADFNNHVKKDQILATLDPTPFEASVNQTKAQLDRQRIAATDAESKYKRQKALFEANLASQDQLDSAKALLDQNLAQVVELQASLERAQTNLSYSVIRAPIDGVVVSRDYDVGQTVAASFQAPTLFTIAQDLTQMQLTCQVDEADIGQVKIGQPVRFSVDSFPEREFGGSVSQIRLSPQVTQGVVTYPVIVAVTNADLALLPGMTAETKIEVARVEAALRVPASALRFRPELLGLNGGRASGGGATGRPLGGPGGGSQGAPGRPQGAPGGGRGATRAADGDQAARERTEPSAKTARVYLAPARAGDRLRPVEFVTGLTDGQYIEVRRGELQEGARIVVGLATAQSQEVGGLAGMARGGRH